MPFVFVIPGALREFSGGRAEVRVEHTAAEIIILPAVSGG